MRSEAWRPAAAARNRSPREAGTPPSRHYDLGARSSLQGSARQLPAVVGRRAPKETEARPREPKTATVERREASVPRHGKVPLHSTPRVSIWLDLTYCTVGIYVYRVLLRSIGPHPYISDTSRTPGSAFPAQAAQREARKRHRPPQAGGAEETLLDPDQPRHPSRLQTQRRGRHMVGPRCRRRRRVD